MLIVTFSSILLIICICVCVYALTGDRQTESSAKQYVDHYYFASVKAKLRESLLWAAAGGDVMLTYDLACERCWVGVALDSRLACLLYTAIYMDMVMCWCVSLATASIQRTEAHVAFVRCCTLLYVALNRYPVHQCRAEWTAEPA